MLSVLIPIYNFDVRLMVQELHKQLSENSVSYEIRCYDDHSSNEFKAVNREVMQLENVIYEEIPKNLGRSAIRNKLARDATQEYVLFLDCDGEIHSSNFIQDYLNTLSKKTVVYGGRSYRKEPPIDRKTYLRWLYGSKREVVSYNERQIHPYRSFMTNNFAMPKLLYLSIELNERVRGYGHEDTLFGIELKNNKIPIRHIPNPLCHIGLEQAEEFMRKTEEGVRNLYFLVHEGILPGKEVKLWKTYRVLRRLRLDNIAFKQFRKRKVSLYNKLVGNDPDLRTFDFYKLGILLECYRDNEL